MSTPLNACHAYRYLLRASLQAIQYSKPSRFVLRDRLRRSFRAPLASRPDSLSQSKLDRTLAFLRLAATTRGPEHKLLKNLLLYWGREDWRRVTTRTWALTEYRERVRGEVDWFVERLGRSMDIYVGVNAEKSEETIRSSNTSNGSEEEDEEK